MERGNSYICKFPSFPETVNEHAYVTYHELGYFLSADWWTPWNIFFRPDQTTENVFITVNAISYFLSKAHTRI